VQVIKRVKKLIPPGQYLIGWKRSSFLRHHLGEIVAGYELHDEKLPIALRKVVADTWQCRVVHAGEQSRFTLELFSQTLLGNQRLLQRNRGIEALVHCFVDGAHTSLPQLSNDAISTL
jgi:hypothetical protein